MRIVSIELEYSYSVGIGIIAILISLLLPALNTPVKLRSGPSVWNNPDVETQLMPGVPQQ